MINLTINNKAIQTEEGTTIFEAAKRNNILIPHFCYLENVHQIGACRICVVEVEGARTLMASCVTAATEGMKVHTNTEKVRKIRKVLYELILSDHPKIIDLYQFSQLLQFAVLVTQASQAVFRMVGKDQFIEYFTYFAYLFGIGLDFHSFGGRGDARCH